MTDGGNWFMRHRQAWITARLESVGHIDRGDIRAQFEISSSQASVDLRIAQDNDKRITYDVRNKRYRLKGHKESKRMDNKLTFSEALDLAKNGHAIARDGWNGKGMYVFLVQSWTYTDGVRDNFPNLPFLAMKTVDNKCVPWLASQTDMLAADWNTDPRK
jgi:hypothetical protein